MILRWGYCPICEEYDILDGTFMRHRCKPQWECLFADGWKDYYDGWRTIHAVDAEQAAEKFADTFDCESGDYPIVSGREEVIVFVRKPPPKWFDIGGEDVHFDEFVGPWPAQTFEVHGEMIPSYHAYER